MAAVKRREECSKSIPAGGIAFTDKEGSIKRSLRFDKTPASSAFARRIAWPEDSRRSVGVSSMASVGNFGRSFWTGRLISAVVIVLTAAPARGQEPDAPSTADSQEAKRPGLIRSLPGAMMARLRLAVPVSSVLVPTQVKPKIARPGEPVPLSRPAPGSRFDPGQGDPGSARTATRTSSTAPSTPDRLAVRPPRPFPAQARADGASLGRPDSRMPAGPGLRPLAQAQGAPIRRRGQDGRAAGVRATRCGRRPPGPDPGPGEPDHPRFGHWRPALDAYLALVLSGITPDAVVIAFDWPSQRVYGEDIRDINEKGQRAFVAAFHLAVFLSSFPSGSRITLVGQSFGGRVVPSALHVLGGGVVHGKTHEPTARLTSERPDLRVRAVVIGAAIDHNWLDPGQRLDRALVGCEAFLNLYNRKDEALLLYPSLVRSDHRRALGRVGLSNADFEELGPLAARYQEHDVHAILGPEHTLLDAVANPKIARWIAPYAWSNDPGPLPPLPATPTEVAPGTSSPSKR